MRKLLVLGLVVGCICARPAAATQMTRYLGAPDLPLTAAMVEAGGGPQNFDATKLLSVLAGANTDAEVQSLTQRYGKTRVTAFVVTFNHAIDDALAAATKAGVTLPASQAGLAQDGKQLSGHLVAAGTMSDGRFDVGYMLEHLLSRDIHVTIMQQLDADPDVGAQRNADFHVILTSVIRDLRTQYSV
jgi:hypothetical protein